MVVPLVSLNTQDLKHGLIMLPLLLMILSLVIYTGLDSRNKNIIHFLLNH